MKMLDILGRSDRSGERGKNKNTENRLGLGVRITN